MWVRDPVYRAVQQTLVDAGLGVHAFAGGDGLVIPLPDDIGNYASVYLLFQPDGSVKIKESATQYVDFIELAHPDSLDLILASVRKVVKQREDFQLPDTEIQG